MTTTRFLSVPRGVISTSLSGYNGSWIVSIAAFDGVEAILASVLRKAEFWERHASTPLGVRQRLVLNRLLDGFEGKLTSSKWVKLAKVSQPTAARDIDELVDLSILKKDAAGGRSTSYSLVDPQASGAFMRDDQEDALEKILASPLSRNIDDTAYRLAISR